MLLPTWFDTAWPYLSFGALIVGAVALAALVVWLVRKPSQRTRPQRDDD